MPSSPSVEAKRDEYFQRAGTAVGSAAPTAIALDRNPPEGALAGWWCRPGTPGAIVLPNPWDDPEMIAAFADWSWEANKEAVLRLGRELGRVHDLELPDDYWDLLLAPWSLIQLAVVADRLLFLDVARELAPGVPVVGGGTLEPSATIASGVGRVRDDAFNVALMSELARRLGLTVAEAPVPAPAIPAATPATARPRRARAALQVLPRAIAAAPRVLLGTRRGRQIALLGIQGASGRQLMQLARDVRGLRLAPSPLAAFRSEPDLTGGGGGGAVHPERATLAGNAGGSGAEAMFASLLDRLLPRSVLEGYGQLVRASEERYGEPAHVLHGSYSFDDIGNEFLARSVVAGKRIAFAQHGAAALQLEVAPAERVQFRRDSVFISWGGTAPGAKPLPSPYVQRLHDTHRGGEHIVLVEHLVPPDTWPLRFTTTPMGNQAYAEVDRTVAFVEALGDETRRRLALKRFPGQGDDAPRPRALAQLAVPASLAPHPATVWMQRAHAVVVPYPDTPFLEAMVVGVPTIGLWDPAIWRARPDAAPYFDCLASLGIIHSDPIEAARLVEQIAGHADEWWSQRAIQQARHEWLGRFAIIGDWRRPLATTLNDLIAGRPLASAPMPEERV